MAATPTGHGYWFVASDGGIFSVRRRPVPRLDRRRAAGHARHAGWPRHPTAAATGSRRVGGQVYAFGDAEFAGNIAPPVTAPCVGIVAAPGGYRLVDSHGNVFRTRHHPRPGADREPGPARRRGLSTGQADASAVDDVRGQARHARFEHADDALDRRLARRPAAARHSAAGSTRP